MPPSAACWGMRRRPGIAGLQAAGNRRAAAAAAGAERKEEAARRLRELMHEFRTRLSEVAARRRQDVTRDPTLRAHFHQMCAALGVDPLASTKGAFAAALGLGDFYYELGVQVVEACMATTPINGGVIDLRDLLRLVCRRRGSAVAPVDEDDVLRAIGTLKALGGYEILRPEAGGRERGRTLVRSVPRALDSAVTAALEAAAAASPEGCISRAELCAAKGWPEARAAAALGEALEQGVAWLDAPSPEEGLEARVYFPCLSGELLTG